MNQKEKLQEATIKILISKLTESKDMQTYYVIKYDNKYISENNLYRDSLGLSRKTSAAKFETEEEAQEFIDNISTDKYDEYYIDYITNSDSINNLDKSKFQIVKLEHEAKEIYAEGEDTGYKDKNGNPVKVGDIVKGNIVHSTFRGNLNLTQFQVLKNRNTNKYYLKNDIYNFITKGMTHVKDMEIIK